MRVRVCGLCWKDDALLVVNHHHLGPANFWSPPGGGVELYASAQQSLVQEYLEETGLHIEVDEFLFTAEFIAKPLHAIELFFTVRIVGGHLQKGYDPETKLSVISDIAFKSFENIRSLPVHERHGIFTIANAPSDLRNLRGYVRLL